MVKGCISKSLNKHTNYHSVIIKSILFIYCFKVIDISTKSFIGLLLYLDQLGSISMDICITEFNLRMPLILSQHFPVWVASQISMWVRPPDLASARHVPLSVRMSVVVSMSLNQSSSFVESCSSTVGISLSMVVVRFDSLCVACKLSVYAAWFCALVPHWEGAWVVASW